MNHYRAMLVLCALLGWGGVVPAGEDDYLKTLEAETRKIDQPGVIVVPGQQTDPENSSQTDRRRFEAELKKHKGTYSLYSHLQAKDKAEIFKAYLEGADFQTLRRKIVDRRLHR